MFSTINGINFVVNIDEAYLFENVELIYQKSIFGAGIKILTKESKSTNCK